MGMTHEVESELERARRRAGRWSDTDPVDYERTFCDTPFDVPFMSWDSGDRYERTRIDWAEAVIGVAALLVLFVAGALWLQ